MEQDGVPCHTSKSTQKFLQDNVTLRLDRGATIKGTPNYSLYPAEIEPVYETFLLRKDRYAPRVLIVATHGGPKERQAHIDEQALRDEFGDLTGRHYDFCEEYKMDDAEMVMVILGSSAGTAKDVIDALQQENIEYPGGRLESRDREIVVKTLGKQLSQVKGLAEAEADRLCRDSSSPVIQARPSKSWQMAQTSERRIAQRAETSGMAAGPWQAMQLAPPSRRSARGIASHVPGRPWCGNS